MSSQSIRKTKNANENNIIAMTMVIHQFRNTKLQLWPVSMLRNVQQSCVTIKIESDQLNPPCINITL